jgi:hypothetical protein
MPDRKAAPRIELVAPEAHRHVGRHDRAVVLGQMERGVDAASGNRGAEPGDRVTRQPRERGVEQRGVLAFQQPDAAEPVRQRHRRAGAFLGEDVVGEFFVRFSTTGMPIAILR